MNLLADIYQKRQCDEPVILGNGHAGLALYVVLEAEGLCNAEEMIEKHGVHPHRDMGNGIWVSSGSLGQAETVAVGLAMAYPKKTVWLITSDGSCMEGSVYEALRAARKYCSNLRAHIIFNGYGAYGAVSRVDLPDGVHIEYIDCQRYPEWLRGLPGHYLTLTEAQYEELMAA